MNKLALLSLVFAVASVTAHADVINGNFEAGNTGFTTDLSYSPTDYYPESIYDVNTDPHAHHGSFTSYGDHTTGTGNMLIVNGSTDASKKKVWEGTTTSLAAGTYTMSFWLSNMYDSNNVVLKAYADNSLIGSGFTVASGTGTWHQMVTSSFTTAGGVTTLRLDNDQFNALGNDFAIDDIKVQAVPEPMSMTVLGLGAAALLKRKRK